MSATAKTLGSVGIAVLGLLIYVGIFLGAGPLKISLFGAALYLGLALTAGLFILIVAFTVFAGDEASSN